MMLSLCTRCRLRKLILTVIITLLFFICILISLESSSDFSFASDSRRIRPSGQLEYVDQKGLHVIVGHYVGDLNAVPNLTEEIINSNMFSPYPNEGKDGTPVLIPPHLSAKMQQLYRINNFNLMASDRIPLNRSLPDLRRKRCSKQYQLDNVTVTTSVIIVFHNEAWSTLLRTVCSVINRSPHHLLKEILLVDDNSSRKFLGHPLDNYVKELKVKTRVIRSPKRIGLIRARILGAEQAEGDILTFLDAHCECTPGWLEPLVSRVIDDRSLIACPLIDIISDDTFAYIRAFEHHWGAFNWDLHFRWYFIPKSFNNKQQLTDPYKSPAMAGGLFAVDKSYFFELGTYDDQLEVWGGENLELSLRVWQCGGSIEIVPCSHVGHVFRKASPYTFASLGTEVLSANLARVAVVWLDEWSKFFFRFNPVARRMRDKVTVRSRIELRKKLKCKSFKWYLENVWPHHYFPVEGRFFGRIKNVLEDKCLEKPSGKGRLNQPMGAAVIVPCGFTLNQMWLFESHDSGFIATNDNVCLDSPDDSSSVTFPRVRIHACSSSARQNWTYQDERLRHVDSGLCLDLPPDGSLDKGLVIAACSSSASQKFQLLPDSWQNDLP